MCVTSGDDVWCYNRQDWKCRGPNIKGTGSESPETEPLEAHVHGFDKFGDDSIVCDYSSGGVVSMEG